MGNVCPVLCWAEKKHTFDRKHISDIEIIEFMANRQSPDDSIFQGLHEYINSVEAPVEEQPTDNEDKFEDEFVIR